MTTTPMNIDALGQNIELEEEIGDTVEIEVQIDGDYSTHIFSMGGDLTWETPVVSYDAGTGVTTLETSITAANSALLSPGRHFFSVYSTDPSGIVTTFVGKSSLDMRKVPR